MTPELDPRMVLIDLDGTLVDSVPDLAFSVDLMMAELGRPTRGEAEVRNWVGNGVERLVKRALTGTLDGEPDADEFERAFPIFSETYAAHNGERSRLYPGVREGVEMLSQRGLRLGCVTNKAARFTEPLLDALGIADRFGIVVCGDQLPEKKPHPMPLLHAAKHLGAEPAESLMLGDSISDVKAARAAGFSVVCVSYGYNHGLDIRDAEPDAVIDSFIELDGLLRSSGARR
jgi:phosphoglycolate phosphatase